MDLLLPLSSSSQYHCEHPGCHSSFFSKDKLKRHGVTHVPSKSYSCRTCSKSYKRKDHLTRHMMTHNPEKKAYCCPYTTCNSSKFIDNYHLKRHITDVHEASKECHKCSAKFEKKWEKLRHQHFAHGEKAPYVCRTCSQPFFTNSHYYPHLEECQPPLDDHIPRKLPPLPPLLPLIQMTQQPAPAFPVFCRPLPSLLSCLPLY